LELFYHAGFILSIQKRFAKHFLWKKKRSFRAPERAAQPRLNIRFFSERRKLYHA